MNQAEYAKHLGISQQRIAKMLQQGIISSGVVKFKRGTKTGYKIDPKKADVDYQNNRDHHNRPDPKKKKAAPKARKQKPSPAEKEDTAHAAGTGGISYADARKLNEQYKAALKKLEYEEKSGKTVNTDTVKRDAERAARIVKDLVTSWPGRTAPIITPLTDVFEVEQALKQETDQLLTEISKEVLK